MRHLESSTLVRSFGLTFYDKKVIPYTSLKWHQFAVANHGTLVVEADDSTWILERGTGLWLPAGINCTFVNRTAMPVRMLYFPVDRSSGPRIDATKTQLLSVTPLLSQLVERTIMLGALSNLMPNQVWIASLIADEISSARELPPSLKHPVSEWLVDIASQLEKVQCRRGEFDRIVRTSGFSRRTIERNFMRETGLSPGTWLKKRRLLLAVEMLLAGLTVDDVSFQLGYSGASAFIAMFKAELGQPPREYVRRSGHLG